MVQLGSSAGFDGFVQEHRPDSSGGDVSDEGLSGAVHALIESVNATSRQFAEAAENFAHETMRVMEGFLSKIDHSASESRDMAGLAGRAADEARKVSDEAKSAIDNARDEVRAEVESMMSDMRAQLDAAMRSTSESVANARQAAEESEQRSREAGERVDQTLASSREAAAAAEAAAEAARRSLDSIEEAAARARESVTAQAGQAGDEAVARIEESLAASKEAAAAAEHAAEDARAASIEAMNYAADVKSPSGSGLGSEAHDLLDRLEADYQLLTDLVQSLHSRLSGLGQPTPEIAETRYEPPAESEAHVEGSAQTSPTWTEPETDFGLAHPVGVEAPESDDENVVRPAAWHSEPEARDGIQPSLDAPPLAWEGWAAPSEEHAPEMSPATEASASLWAPESDTEASPAPEGEHPNAEEGGWLSESSEPETPISSSWWTASSEAPVASEDEVEDAPSWPEPMASTPHDESDAASSHWGREDQATETLTARTEDGVPAWLVPPEDHWSDTEAQGAAWGVSDEAEPAAEGPTDQPPSGWSVITDSEEATSEPAESPWPPSPSLWQPEDAISDTEAKEETPVGVEAEAVSDHSVATPEALVLSGRVVLKASPVPDFDRLLSLDGALGRMSCIKNVTLADYAKEEVTFRVELHDATRVEDFVKDLSNAGSVTLEVTAVSPGELELHIAWTGS